MGIHTYAQYRALSNEQFSWKIKAVCECQRVKKTITGFMGVQAASREVRNFRTPGHELSCV